MEARLQRFSQHFHKSYQTTKLFSHLTFVVYGMLFGFRFGLYAGQAATADAPRGRAQKFTVMITIVTYME